MNRLTHTGIRAVVGIALIVGLLLLGSLMGGGLAGLLARLKPGKSSESMPPSIVGKPKTSHEIVLHGVVQGAGLEVIKAPVDGVVGALIASEGQPVAAGQMIMQLSNTELQTKLREAQKRLKRAQATQAKVKSDPELERLQDIQKGLANAVQKLEEAQIQLRNYSQANNAAAEALKFREQAEENARRAQRIYLSAKETFEQLQAKTPATSGADSPQLVRARQNMDQAQKALDLIESQVADCRRATDKYPQEITHLKSLQRQADALGKRKAQLEETKQKLAAKREAQTKVQRQVQLQSAETAVKAAETALAALAVKAPCAGRLQTLAFRPGQKVKAGQVLAKIEVTGGSRLVFEASLDDADQVQVGQDMTVEPLGGSSFAARVSQVLRLEKKAQVMVQPRGEVALPVPKTALVGRIHKGR